MHEHRQEWVKFVEEISNDWLSDSILIVFW